MINLLPEEIRTEIVYGRRNWWLMQRLVAVVCVMFITAGFGIAGAVYSNHIQNDVQNSIADNKNKLENPRWAKVKSQNKDLNDQVGAITALLKQEVKFSEVIRSIAGSLPQGSVLSGGLALTPNQSGAISLTVRTKSQDMTASLVSALTKSNGTPFKTAVINNSSCDAKSADDYKCTIQLSAEFRDGVFLKPKAAGKAK